MDLGMATGVMSAIAVIGVIGSVIIGRIVFKLGVKKAGVMTEEGARRLDPSGRLAAGIPLCPPEGDAGTGMAATNSVAVRTGNVSAGTSIFAMVVLEKELSRAYPEIDMVTTPAGPSRWSIATTAHRSWTAGSGCLGSWSPCPARR